MKRYHDFRRFATLLPLAGAGLAFIASGCSTKATDEDEHAGSVRSALTAAQCSLIDVNGKVRICHKTSSSSNPYTSLRISEQACIQAHSHHGDDYVTSDDPNSPLYDPTCQGGGCLPVDAPCDSTLPCCEGTSCTDGTCQGPPPDPCEGVICVALDQCHVAGTCDSQTGFCSNPAAPDGTMCSDGNACTATDTCGAGTCTGSGTPCENGGVCTADGAAFTCACAPGWTGVQCEIDIDECQSNPCVHGDCVDGINQYTCECSPGWEGVQCEIDIDECQSNPCLHGLCIDGINQYTCACDPGWTGAICDTNVNECAPEPCQNGGTCTDGTNSYSCACQPGWTGVNCEINIDECESNPCVHGLCVDGINQYTCTCQSGWSGTTCETNVDECSPQPCQNGGTCTDGVNSYTCTCPTSYLGQHCETLASSCLDLLNQGGSVGDGIYTIDSDGAGPGAPRQVYCDMSTDTGGWTLALAYNHVGGQDNPLVLGIPLSPTTGYAHMSNATMQSLAPYTAARFYCTTSAHARVMHFKTGNVGVLNYIRNGAAGNAVSYWTTGPTLLAGHTANLPVATASVFPNQGNYSMTEFPFWKSAAYHWGISAGGSRWECDDYPNNAANSTLHQVWVR